MSNYEKRAIELAWKMHTLLEKHQATLDALNDVFVANRIDPDEGRKLLCLLVGMSLGIQTRGLPEYDELAPFLDWIAGGVITAVVYKK